MNESIPSLDAIPLPGETKTDPNNDKKKPKLRRLQDSNQPSSIIVTKVVATKTSNTSDPASKLKAIAEKKKHLPTLSSSSPTGAIHQPPGASNTYSASSSCSNVVHSKNQPLQPSQTIVDELFKDFLATKNKEDQISGMKKRDPDIATSMEEMSKLLDEEISSINAKQFLPLKSKSKKEKKGRWDNEEKKNVPSREEVPPESEMKKKGRWDSEVKKERTSSPSIGNFVGVVSSILKDSGSSRLDNGVNGAKKESEDRVEDEDGGKKGAVKLGMKLEISKESLSWISSGEVMDQKKKVILEEGEVLSSTSDDNSDDESDDSDNNNDFMETGSLSNSDKEGKSKSKKKKKHKHKHKKKKKKSGKSERKSKERSNKDEKEGKKELKKDKSEDGKRKDKERKKEEKKEHKSKNADKRRHSRSRSRSPKKVKTRSRSRSRETYRERFGEWDARNYRRSQSRSRSRSRERSRSHDRTYDRAYNRDREQRHREYDDRHRDRERYKGDHDDRYREHGYRDRDRSSDRDRRDRDRHGVRSKKEMEKDLRVKIDKSKLRKIAIANVLAAVKAGEQGADVDLATLKAGGKSVEELTDFCKKISEKERDYSDSDSDSDYGRHSEGDDLESPFINHPFKLRDPSSLPNIIMNIRNSKQLPVLTPQAKATQSAQLRLQFPVSSGSQHRQKENEWVPVEKTTVPAATTNTALAIVPAVGGASSTSAIATATVSAPAPAPATAAATGPAAPSSTLTAAQVATQIATANTTPAVAPEDKVFPDPPPVPIDIGAIVSERLSLVRKLTENPYDVQALCSLHKSQEKSSQWAQSKFLPGQYTGSTGVQTLSQLELAGPDKKNQAWFKKDQLKKAAPVQGGIGMWLLQKMGWKQGQGLGKNNEGSRDPLMLDFKIDRRGLTSEGENSRKSSSPANRVKDLSGKHPVSALTELCNKRRWGPPNFITVAESGPDHKKNFLFKVVVNGTEYQPSTASANKKLAKAQAASVCLQEMGLIPRE